MIWVAPYWRLEHFLYLRRCQFGTYESWHGLCSSKSQSSQGAVSNWVSSLIDFRVFSSCKRAISWDDSLGPVGRACKKKTKNSKDFFPSAKEKEKMEKEQLEKVRTLWQGSDTCEGKEGRRDNHSRKLSDFSAAAGSPSSTRGRYRWLSVKGILFAGGNWQALEAPLWLGDSCSWSKHYSNEEGTDNSPKQALPERKEYSVQYSFAMPSNPYIYTLSYTECHHWGHALFNLMSCLENEHSAGLFLMISKEYQSLR